MARQRMTGEQRRQSIIEASIAVIARTSFERCTTAMIAKEAGVTEPLIYNHFSGKKALQLAVLDNILEDFLTWTDAIDDIPDMSFEQMRSYGKLFQRDIKKNPDRITVFFKAQCVEDPQVKDKVWELLKSIHTALVRILSKVVEPEWFAGLLDVEIIAWQLTAWVSNLSLLNQLGRHDEIPEEKVDQFAEFLDWVKGKVMESRD